ncbi:hypothetical protein CFP56_038152 [Quercus suber]|uniref:Uncharacterized protein n=1 Tax=Quercus suber TaxID=58331 RepID=A0AAW0J2G4_QUESU
MELKWINEDFMSYSLECNFMQNMLLDFLFLESSCPDLDISYKVYGDGIVHVKLGYLYICVMEMLFTLGWYLHKSLVHTHYVGYIDSYFLC